MPANVKLACFKSYTYLQIRDGRQMSYFRGSASEVRVANLDFFEELRQVSYTVVDVAVEVFEGHFPLLVCISEPLQELVFSSQERHLRRRTIMLCIQKYHTGTHTIAAPSLRNITRISMKTARFTAQISLNAGH